MSSRFLVTLTDHTGATGSSNADRFAALIASTAKGSPDTETLLNGWVAAAARRPVMVSIDPERVLTDDADVTAWLPLLLVHRACQRHLSHASPHRRSMIVFQGDEPRDLAAALTDMAPYATPPLTLQPGAVSAAVVPDGWGVDAPALPHVHLDVQAAEATYNGLNLAIRGPFLAHAQPEAALLPKDSTAILMARRAAALLLQGLRQHPSLTPSWLVARQPLLGLAMHGKTDSGLCMSAAYAAEGAVNRLLVARIARPCPPGPGVDPAAIQLTDAARAVVPGAQHPALDLLIGADDRVAALAAALALEAIWKPDGHPDPWPGWASLDQARAEHRARLAEASAHERSSAERLLVQLAEHGARGDLRIG